jgi:hypothetical protein
LQQEIETLKENNNLKWVICWQNWPKFNQFKNRGNHKCHNWY